MDERIDKAIEKWRKILLMDDWDIEWKFDDSLGVDGQVRTHPNEHEAIIRFKVCVSDYKDEALERLVAHELLHAVLQPIDDYLDPWVKEYLPRSIAYPFIEYFNDIENRVIEDLLRILIREGKDELPKTTSR